MPNVAYFHANGKRLQPVIGAARVRGRAVAGRVDTESNAGKWKWECA